jgi:hypothetical protein
MVISPVGKKWMVCITGPPPAFAGGLPASWVPRPLWGRRLPAACWCCALPDHRGVAVRRTLLGHREEAARRRLAGVVAPGRREVNARRRLASGMRLSNVGSWPSNSFLFRRKQQQNFKHLHACYKTSIELRISL